MWHVYMLKSLRQKWYYVGSSNDLVRRVKEHNSGQVLSTKNFAPLQLVFQKNFTTEAEARRHERMLKDRRRAKEALIQAVEN